MSLDPSPSHARPGPPRPPTGLGSLDELIARLAELREWAGQPSFTEIADRVRTDRAARGVPEAAQRVSRSTVWDLFRSGRNRIDAGLLIEVVRALGVDATGAAAWRHAYGHVAGGSSEVRRLVAIRDSIPAPEGFAAREQLVAELASAPHGTTVVLAGMAGVGKSQLALHVAAARGGSEPALFVPLGGGDRRQLPVAGQSLLRDLLISVGVTPRRLGGLSFDEQQRLWAGWLTEHRPLVVFDDATDAAQLLPVVPSAHNGFIVVTTRTRLALPGATTVMVEPFPDTDSVEFLRRSAGVADPGDQQRLERISELCGGVPLELAVAAARIAEQPDWTMEDHVRRLERLPAGRTLSAALSATTDRLDGRLHRTFRRLALHPGHRIRAWSTAALAGVDEVTAAGQLDELAALSLLNRSEGDGWAAFQMHDLVREHAAGLLHEHDAYTAQAAAVADLCATTGRLINIAVNTTLPMTSDDRDASPPGPDDLSAALKDPDTARSWLAAESLTLVELVDLAVTFDLHQAAGELYLPIVRFLDVIGEWDLADKTVQRVLTNPDPHVRARALRSQALVFIRQSRYDEAIRALENAREVGDNDSASLEQIHSLLGGVYAGMGRLHDALREHERAVEIADASGDPLRQGRAHGNVANRLRELGDSAGAERELRRALEFDQLADDAIGRMMRTGNLGLALEDQHRDDEALPLLQEALRMADQLGSRMMHPLGLVTIGRILARAGDVGAAREHFERGLQLGTDIGAEAAVAEAHCQLGELDLEEGRLDDAVARFELALRIAREGEDRKVEITALNVLGRATLAAGDRAAAIETHRQALALAQEAAYKIGAARAHRDLATALGATSEADTHRAEAERLFAEMGVPYDG